eukprot:SAG31_NODE_1211_length_9376_cov_2.931767_3_plen_185_part_00
MLLLINLPALAAEAVLASTAGMPQAWRHSTIAAAEIVLLDGDDWHVEGVGRAFSSKCTGGGPSAVSDDGCAKCEEGTNYTAPAVGPHGWYSVESLGMGDSWTQADCVELCAATSGCAAAVWTDRVHGHAPLAAGTGCGFRTADEVAHGSQAANGTTACIPTDLRRVPVSIAATVPGDLVTDLQV